MPKYEDLNSQLDSENGDIKLSFDSDAINNAIKNIVTTQKYTVPGNPKFGCDLEQVLFDIMDDLTFSFISEIITTELEQQEPRINVIQIEVSENPDFGQLLITIIYEIKNTKEIESTLVKIELG